MRDGWVTVPLGDVAVLDIERVAVTQGRSYQMAGVLNGGQGLFMRDALTSDETSYDSFHRLRAGQLVMRKLTAFEGSIGIVPQELDRFFVSTEFPTFTLNRDRLLPSFTALVCQQPSLWHAMWLRSTGTVQRRKRVSPGALLEIPVQLPPLAEQRRIVDLVGNLGEQQNAAATVVVEAGELLRALRDELVTGPRHRLDDLIEDIDGGTSPVTEARPPRPGERAVLKLSAVRSGRLDATEAKAVSDSTVLRSASVLRRGDVLITRSNTPERVGDVAYVDTDYPMLHLSDLTLRIHTKAAVLDPEYLTHALLSTDLRRAVRASASGTSSNMKKISRSKIREYLIPTPPLTEQQRIVGLAGAIDAIGRASAKAADAAALLREPLLVSLLTGEHEIPETYDEFLAED